MLGGTPQYVFPRRSRLERGRVDEVYAEIDRDLDTFMGAAFEECSRAWLGAYAGASRVGELDEIGSWMSRDGRTEIDVVGVRRRDARLRRRSRGVANNGAARAQAFTPRG